MDALNIEEMGEEERYATRAGAEIENPEGTHLAEGEAVCEVFCPLLCFWAGDEGGWTEVNGEGAKGDVSFVRNGRNERGKER